MFIAWFSVLFAFSGNAENRIDLLNVDDELKAFVSRHVDAEAGSYRKIQQLKDALFSNRGAALEYAYRATTRPSATVRKGVADCVSFSFLFVALAREIGLDAVFQEVRGDAGWRQMGRFGMQTIHLNVLVLVDSREIVVDFPRFESMKSASKHQISDLRAMAHFYNNLGVDAIMANQLDQAGGYLELAADLAPDFAGCLANLGVYYKRTGRIADAQQAYMQALEFDPNSAVVSANLAQLLFHQGLTVEAENIYASVGKSKFQNPFYHYNRGKDALDSGDLDKARKRFRKAVKMLPEISGFHKALAVVDLRKRAIDQGVNLNEKASGLIVVAGDDGGVHLEH